MDRMRTMHATCVRSCVAMSLWLLPLVCAGQGKTPAVVSTSQIMIDGGGFQGQPISLPKVSGDWFVTGDDAHADLNLETAGGAQRVVLQLQWDGAGATHTITHENNDTVVGAGHSTFYLLLPPGGAASPQHSDRITIAVTRMDDNAIEARLTGTATGNSQLRFTGTISLRRTGVHVVRSSGAWHDCDPQIHDKMAGAEDRSPSECEVKFDRHVREVLQQAFAPVISGFESQEWTVSSPPNLGPVTSMERHSEGAPYRLDTAHEGAFRIGLALRQDSAAYQRFAEKYQQQMAKLSQQMAEATKGGGTGGQAAIEQMAQTLSAQSDGTAISITVLTNRGSAGVVNFKGVHTVSALPGGGTIVFVPGAQPSTGGGADAAQAMTWVLVGPWGAPAFKSLGGDGEQIDVSGGLKPGTPTLHVQNVWVRIRTSKELAAEVIERADWGKIRALLEEN